MREGTCGDLFLLLVGGTESSFELEWVECDLRLIMRKSASLAELAGGAALEAEIRQVVEMERVF